MSIEPGTDRRTVPLRAGRVRPRWWASPDGQGWSGGPAGLWYCLKVFVGVRVLLTALGLAAVAVLPHAPPGGGSFLGATVPGPVGVPGWPAPAITSGWSNAVTMWERFDALWFLRIAAHGYAVDDGSAAFFPLFPLLVRAVSFAIGGHPLAAGLVVSNAASLGSLLLLYGLTREELSEETARGTVLFASFFPTAFFFVAPYSESLFLLLAVAALWAARRRRWWVAGAAGALAALTRNLGVLLVLPLVAEAIHQALERRPRRVALGTLWSLAPVAGTGLYLSFWQGLSGDWLAPLHQQAGWQRTLAAPWWTMAESTRLANRFVGVYPGGYHLLDWLIAVPVVVAGVVVVLRHRPAYGVFVWTGLLVPLAFVFEPRPLMSFPRFVLPLFPIFWVLARWTEESRTRREIALGASAALMGFLFLLFVNWYYVF